MVHGFQTIFKTKVYVSYIQRWIKTGCTKEMTIFKTQFLTWSWHEGSLTLVKFVAKMPVATLVALLA